MRRRTVPPNTTVGAKMYINPTLLSGHATFFKYVIHLDYQCKIFSEYSVASDVSISVSTPCQMISDNSIVLPNQRPKRISSEARIEPTTKMVSDSGNAHAILTQLQAAGSAYAEQKPGAREQLLSLSNALITSLELPSETIQRIGWAEVSLLPRSMYL